MKTSRLVRAPAGQGALAVALEHHVHGLQDQPPVLAGDVEHTLERAGCRCPRTASKSPSQRSSRRGIERRVGLQRHVCRCRRRPRGRGRGRVVGVQLAPSSRSRSKPPAAEQSAASTAARSARRIRRERVERPQPPARQRRASGASPTLLSTIWSANAIWSAASALSASRADEMYRVDHRGDRVQATAAPPAPGRPGRSGSRAPGLATPVVSISTPSRSRPAAQQGAQGADQVAADHAADAAAGKLDQLLARRSRSARRRCPPRRTR